jgi:hypothetical protein
VISTAQMTKRLKQTTVFIVNSPFPDRRVTLQ